jgi:hypothetical protein
MAHLTLDQEQVAVVVLVVTMAVVVVVAPTLQEVPLEEVVALVLSELFGVMDVHSHQH